MRLTPFLTLPPSLLLLGATPQVVHAASRTSPPSGCLTVSKSGSGFTTIQSAVNSLLSSSGSPKCIFIHPGTYPEQVLVPSSISSLTIYGSTADTSSYQSNTVTITSSLSQAHGLNNDETATLRVKSPNFRLYNVNVENRYGKGSQAVALSAYGSSGYYGCSFRGWQDTLLAQQGEQLFARCEIVGVTDFVFGQRAQAWFEKCDVGVLGGNGNSGGYVSASGRDSPTNPNFYVFNSCTVSAAPGQQVASGTFYLGRPWRNHARVVFQRTSMTNVINPAGWRVWNKDDERTDNVLFGEYGNTGAGASGNRASFATKLSAPVSIASVLGGGYASAGWYDGSYM